MTLGYYNKYNHSAIKHKRIDAGKQ